MFFLFFVLVNKTGEKQHICFQCNKEYTWKKSLKRHLRLECGKEPTFQCLFCPYKAKQKTTLQNHMALKHDFQPV